tara:strand:- start:3047 stop:6400 length:3354 start_codon:yes stop_codon:yes gene_type:complete
MKIFAYLIFLIFTKSFITATNYYVAVSYGDDTNNGLNINAPFKTIGKAASIMSSGDKCYIRQGRYNETISIDNLDGTSSAPVIFTNYNSERVVIDGTIPINSTWVQIGSSNLWRTKLTQDIWQLFINWEEQVMARWPNSKFSDGTIWDNDNYWAKGTIDDNENAYSNGTIIDDPYTNSAGTLISLSSESFDLDETNKQAIAILNLGSFRTWSRIVTNHSGNTFNYATVPSWKTKHHYYYFEGRKEFLDQEGEWWVDTYNNKDSLYYVAASGVDPNKLDFRGKIQSYAFSVNASEYLQIKNLEFFATTVYFSNGDNCLVYGCNFMYPSCSKRMLRIVDTEPEMTKFASGSSGSTIRKCAFRNVDGTALEMWGGVDTVDNCYFNKIDYSVADNSSIMLTVRMNGTSNVFRKNTIHKTGASATIMIGDAGLAEYNNIYDTGYLQSDGAMIQFMEDQQDGAICRYNWLHDTEKYGARFDHSGDADGTNGLMHHNLAWNCESGGIMVKGNNHQVYNNTVLNSGAKNDIIVFQVNSGDHSNTIVKNNAADKIANHRTNDVEINFGTYTNNWNGYKESVTLNSILEDTSNNHFYPSPSSPLIDAGTIISNITDQYTNNGTAPDIGAYEKGNSSWTAGHDWNVNTTFGSAWTPMHNLTISGNSGFRMMSSPVSGAKLSDLLDELWLQGMIGGDVSSNDANVWVLDLAGQSWSTVSNISTHSLSAGEGFLVYVFEDCDNDGDSDFPVDLYVSGSHNQNDVVISSIPANNYFLAGNPYIKTISWNDISRTNLSSVVSVWDDASSDWKTYNGTTGDLTNGLIAPFQGFWVQAFGGVGSFTIQPSDIANSSTSFMRNNSEDFPNFIKISISNIEKSDEIFFTFDSLGSTEFDHKDAPKLVPLVKSSSIAAMIISEGISYKINNLPRHFDSANTFPLQILSLELDSLDNILGIQDTLILNIDEANFSDDIIFNIYDIVADIEYDLNQLQDLSIITDSLGIIDFEGDGPLRRYLNYGNQRYFVSISQSNLGDYSNNIYPRSYQLFQNYPNPFNPITMIEYELPKKELVSLKIFDIMGREVVSLVNAIQKPGLKFALWDATNKLGNSVSAGLYLCTFQAGDFRQTKKMILLK